MEFMHPGLMTQMLSGHVTAPPSRKRSKADVRSIDNAERTKAVVPSQCNMPCAISLGAHSAEVKEDADAIVDKCGEDRDYHNDIDDGVTLDRSMGLMTKMLHHHEEPAVSMRRPAEKCLPDKYSERAHKPALCQGLLTSIFARHALRPSKGRKIIIPDPQTESTRSKLRHHVLTLPSSSGRGRRHYQHRNSNADNADTRQSMCIPQEPLRPKSASPAQAHGGRRSYRTISRRKTVNLRPSLPSARVINPNYLPLQSQFSSTRKQNSGQPMPLKYCNSITNISSL